MCVAPPPVSSAMMCFCLFSYPQMSEISRLFSSFSSSSLHLRPHSGSAFQSANSSPERLTLCLVTKTLIALSLSSQAHSLISAPEYLRNAEVWSVAWHLNQDACFVLLLKPPITQSLFDLCCTPTSDWILMWWGQHPHLSLWHRHHSFDLSGDRPLSRFHRSVFKCFLLLLKWSWCFLLALLVKETWNECLDFECGNWVVWEVIFFFSFYHRTDLSDHLETIDSGIENLQQILNAQSINFDTSTFFDVNIVSVFNTIFKNTKYF